MKISEALGLVPEEQRVIVEEAVNEAIAAEREKGIAETSKRNQENVKLKSYLKELGYDHSKYETIESFVTEKKQSIQNKEVTLTSLQEQLNEITTKYENERKIAQEKEQLASKLKIENTLKSSFGNTFYAQDDIIANLIANKRATIVDDKVLIDNLPVDEALPKLKEEKADSVRNEQQHGNEDNGGSTPPPSSFADAVATHTGNYGI